MGKINRKSELREAVFLLLFRADFYGPEDLKEQIRDFFEDEDAFSDEERLYIAEKTLNIAAKADEIDAALETVSVGWKPKRMTKVDLTILRLAYYEIKFIEDVSASTAINEAVELAKSYGTENSPSFVNGILAKFA
ncbi:MAG: transcription antitermination factor NusB [Parasporobacterium sp.]|nr:transcription antitermination factor NusB [Parasporobacterium sp.]